MGAEPWGRRQLLRVEAAVRAHLSVATAPRKKGGGTGEPSTVLKQAPRSSQLGGRGQRGPGRPQVEEVQPPRCPIFLP